MMRQPIIIMLLFIAAACGGKKSLVNMNVQRAPVTTTSDGFFYFLPRTVVAVDVEVTRTVHQPGPFAQYAENLLGLQQVIRTPSVDYSISGITIQSYAEPDPNHIYFVEFDQQSSHMYLTLSEAGMIQSVNRPFNSDEFLKGLDESKEYGYFGTAATFNYFIDINLQERIDTIMERVRLDTITVERQRLQRSWVEKSTDVRAKEVAEYILKIRDEKFNLISGFAEITYSREAIAYMYEEMIKKENDYLALFTGISSSSTIRYRYTYIPYREGPDTSTTLFHFSVREGVLGESGPGSIPVSIHARRNPNSDVMVNKIQRMQTDRPARKGFFYRVPDYSNIVITEGNRPRAEARMLISQYGVVTSLPPYLMEIEYYPNTGSIKSVGRTSREED